MSRQRNYGITNPFSENHRNNLPGNYCLFDVDGILLNSLGDPEFLYEGKYNRVSKRGDFIKTFYNPKNVQAFFLRYVSEKIGVYIKEEKTNIWWFLKDRDLEECSAPMLDLIKTENRIYIEDIVSGYNQNISGVFVRTEGEKPSEMEKYGDFIAQKMDVPNILVNDVFESDYIHFKRGDMIVRCEAESSWNEHWDLMNII
jgi:hypothetical protein